MTVTFFVFCLSLSIYASPIKDKPIRHHMRFGRSAPISHLRSPVHEKLQIDYDDSNVNKKLINRLQLERRNIVRHCKRKCVYTVIVYEG